MSIIARYPGRCTKCSHPIVVGARIEWQKGAGSHHVTCGAASSAPASANTGRGRPSRDGYVRKCKTDGNCSSFGSGRSCGAPDCDGY